MTNTFRLGLFILTAFAMVCAAVFLVGRQETHFGSNYRVLSEFQTVSGLNEGAEVRVGGMHKGTVRYIRLPKRPDGKVTVAMDLSKDTSAIVRKDSTASIQSEGLLGDKYVEVSFGSVDAPSLRSGDSIEGKPPLDISDLFDKANGILDTSQKALNNIAGASENVNMITAKINSGEGSVGKLVNDKTLYKEATASMTSFHEDADALKHNFLLKGFFNDRGYTNPEEVKKYEIADLPKSTPGKTFTFDAKNLFEKPTTAKLKNSKSLNEAGQFLQAHKFDLAVIESATGMKGDTEEQRVLTEARSYVIRRYLVDHFKLEDTHIKTIGLGKTPNGGPDGTVELKVFGDASLLAETQPSKSKP